MIDLKLFCGTVNNDLARKSKIATPFNEGAYTYATNGSIVVRVPKMEGVLNREDYPPSIATLWNVPDGWNEFKPLPERPEPRTHVCQSCNGSGHAIKCKGCEGRGEWVCDLGHKHECNRCDGTGYIPKTNADDPPCQDCHGTGKRRIYRPDIPVDHQLINEELLDKLYTLPNCTVASNKGNEYGVIAFKFDGGDGLLMPCRK